MSKRKRAILASVGSLLVVALAGLCMTNIGPDGPGSAFAWVGIVLLFVPSMLASAFGSGANIIVPVFGFVQFFGIFWFFLRSRHATSR
ncbi:MAG TPA: hypothetical protein VHI52_18025 [Verrucomicrobiae bacterium]|nr:hypothetical protein [Verrucomicrobiae bacterium]